MEIANTVDLMMARTYKLLFVKFKKGYR